MLILASPELIGPDKQPRAVDFAIRPDSPVWAIGFNAIPVDKIGLYKDDTRSSWPVTHKVR
jgi:hypothetical protein